MFGFDCISDSIMSRVADVRSRDEAWARPTSTPCVNTA
jgi:hypothetical protein